MSRTVGRTCVVALAAWLAAPLTWAQQGSAIIQGKVADESGGVLSDVSITVRNQETGVSRTTKTDQGGHYRLAALQPGIYEIAATLQGFRPERLRDARLTVGQEATLDLTLRIGDLQEAVEVEAAAPLIDLNRSQIAAAVSEKQISELPTLSRDFLQFAALVPGAGRNTSITGMHNLQIGGSDSRYNYTTYIDGGDIDDDIWGSPIMNFTQDGIKEFQVITNRFDAEHGKALEAVVNVVSKSGTNKLGGSAFLFDREEQLRSKSHFEKELGAEKPPYHQRRFGGTLGGPIVKDRTHFFASYEYRDAQGVATVAIPASSPESRNNGVFPTPDTEHLFTVRLDHQLSSNHRLTARAMYDDRDYLYGFGGRSAASVGITSASKSFSVLGQDVWILGSRSVNDFRFQYRFTNLDSVPSSTEPTLERPSSVTGSAFYLSQERRHRYQFYDTLYFTTPRHHLKAGGEITFMETAYAAAGSANGYFYFPTDRPFDANDRGTWPSYFSQAFNQHIQPTSDTYFGLFVQDDWRVRDKLTLNLGVRWDVDANVRDGDTIQEALAQPRNAALAGLVDPNVGTVLNMIDPRVGFAYAARPTLVIRGGYGLHHSRARMFMQNLQLTSLLSDAFVAVVTDPTRLGNYPNIDAILGGTPEQFAASGPRSLFNIMANDFQLPYAHNFSLGFSKQLGKTTSISVDGVHSLSLHDFQKRIANLPPNYSRAAPAGSATNPWPIPGFGIILFQVTDGKTSYDALQLGVTHRRASGFQAQLAYTYSKAVLTGANTHYFTPSKGRGADDHGPTLGDMRHKGALNVVSPLPFGFQISGVLIANTGPPFRVIAGADLDGDSLATEDRPDGLPLNAGGTTSQANLDIVNAFRQGRGLAPVTLDQLGKRYPYLSVDLRLSKFVPLHNDLKLELMAEVFNLFNRTNFGTPNGTLTSAAFLTVSSASPPREAQLGVRVRF